MATYPKYQTCPFCNERLLTQWEKKDNEVEFPGVHACSKGHGFNTRIDPRPGEETFEVQTAD